MEVVSSAGRPSTPGVKAGPLLGLGLPADARVEDIEHLLIDVLETLSRIDTKRGLLQERIAAASRGRRRASRRAPAAGVPEDDDHGALYTRKGTGAVRTRLRAAASGAKKERARLEAVWGDLEEALVDAKQSLALQRGGAA